MALPASDNFDRANGALGANWSLNSAVDVVVWSNRAACNTTSSNAAARWSADTFPDDQYSQADVYFDWLDGTGTVAAGVAVRCSTSGTTATYYRAIVGDDEVCYIDRVVTGTVTNLASVAWGVGLTLRLEVEGTALRAYRDSTLILSTTDATIASGAAGVAFKTGTSGALDNQVDNWAGGEIEPLPADPSGLTGTALATSVSLSWTDNSSNETGFAIERSPNGSTGWTQIATVGAGVTTYNNTGLTQTTTYWYRVRAYHGGGFSGYSSTFSITTLTLPADPSGLTATAVGFGQISLAWTDNSSNETGFVVERASAGSGGPFSVIGTTGAGVAVYQDAGLADLATYWYRVAAVNAGGSSAYTSVASATTPAGPTRIIVKIAFDDPPLAGSVTYTDVTDRLRNDEPVTIRRGRNNELGRFETGEASFLLDNRDRAFDPHYTASPYYPNVKPRRRVQIAAAYAGDIYELFTGFARFEPRYGQGGSRDHVVRVRALDAFDLFARMPLVERDITTWTPAGGATTRTLVQDFDMPGGGQARVRLAEAPSGTQEVQVTGYNTAGGAPTDIYTLTSANWEEGVIGDDAFRQITQLQSYNAGSTHRAVIVELIPAYAGGVGFTSEFQAFSVLEYAGYESYDLEDGDITMAPWAATQETGWVRPNVASGVADTVFTALQRIVEAESGQCYVRGDGTVILEAQRRRRHSYFPDAQVLGSGAGEVPYSSPTFSDGDEYVINQVRLAGDTAGKSRADATDAEIAEYGRRVYDRSGMIMRYTSEQDAEAARLVYHRKEAVPRVTGVTLTGEEATFPTMFAAEISSPLTVRLRPPNVGDYVDRPCWVERLEWRISRGAWSLRLGLSPAELGNDIYRSISGAGMAFPTSPYTNQVFYRDDLGLLCYYDGTRWLTVAEYVLDFQPGFGITANTEGYSAMRTTYDAYVTRVTAAYSVSTTNNGSNYWSFVVRYAAAATTIATLTTAAASVGTWTRGESTPNTVVAQSTALAIQVSVTKTGSPGALYSGVRVTYRLVIT